MILLLLHSFLRYCIIQVVSLPPLEHTLELALSKACPCVLNQCYTLPYLLLHPIFLIIILVLLLPLGFNLPLGPLHRLLHHILGHTHMFPSRLFT